MARPAPIHGLRVEQRAPGAHFSEEQERTTMSGALLLLLLLARTTRACFSGAPARR